MALGIDIYRYQTVTDPQAVKDAGVAFAYVKGTDGGGPALVRADHQVRQMHSVGVAVGLYHYAQLSPSPEAQADILTAEVSRLDATGLPPALDLEDPHRPGPAARDFAFRFLNRLRDNGFDSVCLYANTSMLTGINADTIGVPNTIVWAAQYGPNDGRRHPLRYNGRANIHQYTSVGGVRGISGRVDLNESLTALPSANGRTDEVSWSEASGIAKADGTPYSMKDVVDWTNRFANLLPGIDAKLDLLSGKVDEGDAAILAAVRQIPGADPHQQAQLLAQLLAPMVKGGATQEQVRAACDAAIAAAFDRAAGGGAEQ